MIPSNEPCLCCTPPHLLSYFLSWLMAYVRSTASATKGKNVINTLWLSSLVGFPLRYRTFPPLFRVNNTFILFLTSIRAESQWSSWIIPHLFLLVLLILKYKMLVMLGQTAHWWVIWIGTGGQRNGWTEGMDKEKVTDILWLVSCCPGTMCWHTDVHSHTHTCPLLSPCPSVTVPSAQPPPYSFHNQRTRKL